MKMTLVPFDSVAVDLPRAIAKRLRAILPWRFSVATPLPDPVPPAGASALDVQQLLSLLPASEHHSELWMGLTGLDMTAPGLDYIFGYAAPEKRAAVVSLHRLADPTGGRRCSRRLLVERATREILHEAGHLMGLPHCDEILCVMRYSQTLQDTDIKHSLYCNRCLTEMSRMPEPAGER
jgi:predicted Zn-dependent protease